MKEPPNSQNEVVAIKDEAFGKIKPTCVKLSQITFRKDERLILDDPQLKQLLVDLIQNLDSLLLNVKSLPIKFGDYVFVPISAMLKTCKSLPDEIATLIFGVLARIVELSWTLPGAIALDTLSQLLCLSTFLISSDLENRNLPNKTDEFKLAAIMLLRALYSTAEFKKWDRTMLSAIAHSITILLNLLETGGIEIQLESSKTLRMLYRVLDDGEMLSNVVPGNVSTFTKVLLRPGLTTNAQVAADVLSTMAELLCKVYDDYSINATTKKSAGIVIIEAKNPGKHRSTQWLIATSAQLKRALEPTFKKLTKRSNQKLKDAVFKTCIALLDKCYNSLYVCREFMLKAALIVGCADVTALRRYKTDIAQFMRDVHFEISTGNEDDENIGIVNNVLQVLDTDQISEYQLSKKLVGRIHASLNSQLIKLDKKENTDLIISTDSEINSMVNVGTFKESEVAVIPKISLTTYNSLANILLKLGSLLSTSLLQDQITEYLSVDTNVLTDPCPEIWITSLLLKGYKSADMGGFLDIDSSYTSCQYDILELANERISILSNQPKCNELQSANMAMDLFAIKQMILLMGNDFKEEMLEYIYNIIECFASNDEIVRSISGDILQYLAKRFYEGSMLSLLQDNVDYIVDGISIRLDNCLFQRAYMVLHLIIKLSEYSLIERLNDILEKLFWMLGYYHGYDDLCVVLLKLFMEISYKIHHTFLDKAFGKSIEIKKWNQDSFKPWGMKNIEQVLDLLDQEKSDPEGAEDASGSKPPEQTAEEFFKSRFENDSDDDGDDGSEVEENDQSSDLDSSAPTDNAEKDEMKWVSPIPRNAYMLLLRLWTYADRLLTHSSRIVRHKSLDLLIYISPMLSSQQVVFLPNVAKIWDVVVQLSITEDLAQVSRSYELLNSLVSYTDSFLLKRVLDMWTILLHKNTPVSKALSPAPPTAKAITANALQLQAHLKCVALLTTCMNQFGLQLPDHVSIEMCQYIKSLHITDHQHANRDTFRTNSNHVSNILMALDHPDR